MEENYFGEGEAVSFDSYQDDGLVLDLDNVSVEQKKFDAIPAGVYNAIVENVEVSISSSGNPMMTWQFRVVDAKYENRMLFFHTVLNKDTGLARLKRTLVRIIPEIQLTQFNPKAFCDEGIALGRDCRLKLRTRMYQGKRVNDVSEVLAGADDVFLSV